MDKDLKPRTHSDFIEGVLASGPARCQQLLSLGVFSALRRPAGIKRVAKAANGMNPPRAGGVVLDLVPQAQHAYVHGSFGNDAVSSPDFIQELLAAAYAAGSAHQALQQFELRGGNSNLPAATAHFEPSAVQFQLLTSQNLRTGSSLSQLSLDAGNQFPDEEGLYQIVIGADLESNNAIRLIGPGREENDRKGRQLRMSSDGLADINPIGVRKHHVKQQQVRLGMLKEYQSIFSALVTDEAVPLFFEVVPEQLVEVYIVFDQRDRLHGACHPQD